MFTALIFPILIGTIIGIMNSLAIVYGSSAAIPIDIILKIISSYLLINFPLTLASGFFVKNMRLDDKQ